MIFANIIQNDLSIDLDQKYAYQHSQNLTFHFEKDNKYMDYLLKGYIQFNSQEYALDLDDSNNFTLDSRYFEKSGRLKMSFSLEKGDEIIHLGVINFSSYFSIGNGTTPLPEQEILWVDLVKKEVLKITKPIVDDILNDLDESAAIDDNDMMIANIDSSTKKISLSNFIDSIKKKLGGVGGGSVSFDESTGNLIVESAGAVLFDESTGNLTIGG